MPRKKLTEEEALEILKEAIRVTEKADGLMKKSDELFKRIGVVPCGNRTAIGICYHRGEKYTFHVHRGIKNLAKVLNAELYHPKYYESDKEPMTDKLAVSNGVYEFFELGDKTARGYSFQ